MNIKYEFDTICALATPFGVSGVGVIRLSGEQSWQILKNIFSKQTITAGKIEHGWILDKSEKVDEVVVLPFKAPHSYTGEDVIEIQCHGGINIIRKIMELLTLNGARTAQKGEFTKRAFMNGRIDLSKAEAVNDIIHAKSIEFAQKNTQNLAGVLSSEISSIRNDIFNLLSKINAAIDFPEDVAEPEYNMLEQSVNKIIERINRILKSAKTSNIMREGIKVAIIGKPNSGKSSLFNKLLNVNRAIVTQIPGTTRDVLYETLCIDGIPVTLIDTAGIREDSTVDTVEEIGINYSKQLLESADIILFVYDAYEGYTENDDSIFNTVKNKNYIKIGTKTDLCEENFEKNENTLYVSNITDYNIEKLKEVIIKKIIDKPPEEIDFVTNNRQQDCLKKSLDALNNALLGIQNNILQDLISIDIKSALLAVDEVSGEVITDKILDNIFENFCIGK